MTPEVRFYRQIDKHLPGFTQRVENVAGTGTPDVMGACVGVGNFWVELKVSPNSLSPIQERWHMYNVTNGGKSFVLTKFGKTKYSTEHVLVQKAAANGNRLVLLNVGVVVKGSYALLKEKIKNG